MKMLISGLLVMTLIQPALAGDRQEQPIQPPAVANEQATTVETAGRIQPEGERKQTNRVMSNASLRDIDQLVVQLAGLSQQLHDEYHDLLHGIRHAEKLDDDVTALERMSEALHTFATQADGTALSVDRLRGDTNAFIQQAARIIRSVNLIEPWLPGNVRSGNDRLRSLAGQSLLVALQIDRYLPVDTLVIDVQTENLEAAIKELHDEFHEHLEGYEVSAELDEGLGQLESLVEQLHELAHDKSWQEINLSLLMEGIDRTRQATGTIETLFGRQAKIGVRTRDWVGIEHSRDAITDVLASAFLLEHMIRKTAQGVDQPQAITQTESPPAPQTAAPQPPQRDRHGHLIEPSSSGQSPIRDRQVKTGGRP